MKTVPLSRGLYALIDDCDYEEISKFKWYAMRRIRKTDSFTAVRNDNQKSKRSVLMHRQLMSPPEGMEIDHINGNALDNRKCNLRIVTHAQNARGFWRKRSTRSSEYRGVSWHKQIKRWRARIKFNQMDIFIGTFKDEKDAALAYNSKAAELGFQKEAMNIL